MIWADWFYYSAGLLYNKVTRGSRAIKDTPAGSLLDKYYVVMFEGSPYQVHNIIWELHYGPIPEGMTVDHIDCNTENNVVSNFRLASKSQQQWNKSKALGKAYKGVHYRKPRGTWYGQLKAKGVKYTTKQCSTALEANELLMTLRHIHHKEFTRHV